MNRYFTHCLSLFLFLMFSTTLISQKEKEITVAVKWHSPILKTTNLLTQIYIPSAENLSIEHFIPKVYYREKISSENFDLALLSYETEVATNEEKKFLKDYCNINLDSLNLSMKVTKSRNTSFAVFDFVPFIKVNNQILRIKSFQVKLNPKPDHFKQKDFVAKSVLADGSGNWYKIAISEDGIYKLDKQFLENCGINTTNLNPNSIHIYGNGDGLLPIQNNDYRTDDLAKNAIYFHGDSDGTFDEGDYILFYAWGPHRWKKNSSNGFDQQRHHYSDVSCYFININPSESPLRILEYTPPQGNPTVQVNSFSHRDIHEVDNVSLVEGGQRWYGELFDIPVNGQLEKNFLFNIPNISSGVLTGLNISMASNKRVSDAASVEFAVNGNVLSSTSFSSSSEDYSRIQHYFDFNSSSSSINLKLTVSRSNPSTLAYLDRIVLNSRRDLVYTSNQLSFRDLESVASNQIAEYSISGFPSNGVVWDITNRHVPEKIIGNMQSSVFSFSQNADTLREFVAYDGINFSTPVFVGMVSNQNLHGLEQAEYLIVTNSLFLSEANRLADLHRANGTTVHVVTNEQIYNEFSSGMQDACAIRMFAKMFYDRGNTSPETKPKYLLLFGDGSYDPKDRISNNTNFVLTYQVEASENHTSSLVTDDFFGLLDDVEGMSSTDQLDIGIGRLLATDPTTAKQLVDKIEHYMLNGSSIFNQEAVCCSGENGNNTFGNWRLKIVQIADDEDGNYFIVNDTEPQYNMIKNNHTEFNCEKIYLDAYPQQTTAGGERYPEVNLAINSCVERGALIMHYVGHGGEVGLAQERVVTIPEIQSWRNINSLNLFVSNTCEFTRYDDPGRVSAGEWVSLNPNGASIALMTTTRPVFFNVNTVTGVAFYNNVFQKDSDSLSLTFGEIIRRTKNESGTQENKRSFTLIGDPALRISVPRYKIITDSINGESPSISLDTIKALSVVNIKGHIEDFQGVTMNSFSGVLSPVIFDKIKMEKTLGQDPGSYETTYEVQKNIIYKGKASVVNGYFDYSFIVPKDISLAYGNGKISHYANNNTDDASGFDTTFFIGGINPNALQDNEGPDVSVFLNEESFVSGGITNNTPTLIAKIFDNSGINTVGSGIGHDITVYLDGNTSEPIVLNDYYTADLDTYQSGEVRYHFSDIEQGPHQLTFKVWDVNNNSSMQTIDFIVQGNQDIAIEKVYNYPNPFTTQTEFLFEHNQACNSMDVQIQVFTVSGKLVKSIDQNVNTDGYRINGIYWNGKDDFGDDLGKGVYVYKLKVITNDGRTAEKFQKLVLLK